MWRFFAKQTTFGQLTSIVSGRRDIAGRPVFTLKESLRIDYTKIGGEVQENLSGETYVSTLGRFAGCDLRIGPSETSERLVMTPSDDELTGFYTRGGEENDISLPWPAASFFWDAHLVDQLEIFLAMHDLEIGTVIDDSVFIPQALMQTRIVGQVIYFMWQEIYKGRIDSVFIIRLTEPSACQLYFTPDKKLVRVDMIDQAFRVYQDIVQQTSAGSSSESNAPPRVPFSLRGLILKLPHHVAFALAAAFSVLLLAARAFRWPASYLSFLSGIVLYVAVSLVVNPVLILMSGHWFDLTAVSGSSFYLLGTVLPLFSGLIQAMLVYAGIVMTARLSGAKPYQRAGLGAFLGAAFGLAEAIYLSGWQIEVLFGWPLLEHAAMIVMHTAAGALIGRFMSGNRVYLVWSIVGAALVNGAVRYLPLLVQTRKIGMEAVHLAMAIGAIVYLLVVLILIKKTLSRPPERVEPTPVGSDQD